MKRLFRHKLLVGGIALALAASAGGAYAATQSGTTSRQAFLNDVAKRLGVTPSELNAAVRGALLDRLQAAVKAGELTQAQADGIKRRIEHGGAVLPFGGPLGLRGPMGVPGPLGLRPRFWHHGFEGPGLAMGRHSLLGTAAGYLGLSPAQVIADLGSGKTLAQVARAQGKSVSGLEQELATAAQARLDKLVTAGVMTKAQEQLLLGHLSARIDRLVNHARLDRAPAGMPYGPPPGGASDMPPAGGPPPGFIPAA